MGKTSNILNADTFGEFVMLMFLSTNFPSIENQTDVWEK